MLHAGNKKDQVALFKGSQGRRYRLWWTKNDVGSGGIRILVKKDISGNVVIVRRKSDKVMAITPTLEKEVIRIILAYGPQSGRPDT